MVDVLKNCDICNLIYHFCDVDMMYTLLYTYRSPMLKKGKKGKKKGKMNEYVKFVDAFMKQKEKDVNRVWRWHVNMPDHVLRFSDLTTRTRANLEIMANGGYIWSETALAWDVYQSDRWYKKTDAVTKPIKDIIVIGTHPERGEVVYSRHETGARGAGSTMLWWYADVADKRGVVRNKRISEKVTDIVRQCKKMQ